MLFTLFYCAKILTGTELSGRFTGCAKMENLPDIVTGRMTNKR